MTHKVTWNQWFRCGYFGDDSDFVTEEMKFDSLEEAKEFVEELVAGKFRGAYDRRVNRSGVTITEL